MEYQKNLKVDDKFCATLTITITKDTIRKEYDALLLDYSKKLNLPGFRRGKVPIKVLEAKYSSFLIENLFSNMMEESLEEVFEDLSDAERPTVFSQPEVKDHTKFDLSTDFSFDVVYDVKPIQKILKDSGFELKIPHIYVSDEDVNAELEDIRMRNATIKEKEGDAVVEKDDLVTMSYQVFDGEKEEKKMEDYVFFVGSYDNTYRFDDDILGMKKDEEKRIIKEYPQDFEIEELRGAKKQIVVKIKTIKERDIPPLDDDLAQDVNEKYKNIEELKDDIKKSLEIVAKNLNHREKFNAMLDALIKANPLHIPESMLRGTFARMYQQRAEEQRISVAKLDGMLGMSREDYYQKTKEDIYRQLHISFILIKLKENYKNKIEDNMSEEEITKYSQDHNVDIQELQKAIKEKTGELYDAFEEDRLYRILYENSKFEITDEVKVTDYYNQKNN